MTVKTPTRTFPVIPYRKTSEIDYDSLDFDPRESVKKPGAMRQRKEQRAMLDLLDAYFADDGDSPDVFVDYDTNICWDPDDFARHVSPDVYIAFGVDEKAIRNRLIYLPWEAGKPPDLVMEIATADTAREDVEIKPGVYEAIAAPEYWMFDAAGGRYYGFPLMGRRMVDGKYQEIELTTEPDGVLKGYSEVLGLSLAWDGGFPRLYDHASGMYLESVKEARAARRASDARADAAEAQRDAEKARADDEKARADAAETQRDAFEAQLDMTEMQLESEVRTREAAQEENRRLRELIRRMENG